MVRQRLLRDFLSTFENAAPAPGAEALDEYRELAMLAHAWERGSLEPGAVEGALGSGQRAKSQYAAKQLSQKYRINN